MKDQIHFHLKVTNTNTVHFPPFPRNNVTPYSDTGLSSWKWGVGIQA